MLVFYLFNFDYSDPLQRVAGITGIILIALPIIFLLFLKKPLMRYPSFKKVWKIVLGLYLVTILIFFLLATFGFYRAYEAERTQEAIERIESRKITLADVMGDNLPPAPDKALNDSTVAGIDSNNNAIRDDVELAIFEKYPDSARIRAAMLQYAQALQLELTEVFNSETLVRILQKNSYAAICMGKVGSSNFTDSLYDETKNLVIDIDLRKKIESSNLKKYLTTYSSSPGSYCDLDVLSLPN